MIALKMVRLIEAHSQELAHSLMRKVQDSKKCAAINKVPSHELENRAFEIYRNLSEWLLTKTEAEIEKTYRALGRRRCEQGVPFNDFFWAIAITKENLWDFLTLEALDDDAMNLHGEFELLRLLDQFFDCALYYAAQGYWEEHHKQDEHKHKLAHA